MRREDPRRCRRHTKGQSYNRRARRRGPAVVRGIIVTKKVVVRSPLHPSSARCSTLVSSANRLTMKNLGDERETLVTGRNGTMASGRRVMGASWSFAFFAPVRKYPDFYPG